MTVEPVPRRPDWRVRFDAAIDAVRRRPFDWTKQHDCGPGFAGDLVLAMTGVDLAAPWRGRYSSRTGALRAMRDGGFGTVADLVATLLPEIHPSRLQIGDVAAIAVDSAFGFALGIVNGERIFVMKEDGIGTVGLLDAQRAFRVGPVD